MTARCHTHEALVNACASGGGGAVLLGGRVAFREPLPLKRIEGTKEIGGL